LTDKNKCKLPPWRYCPIHGHKVRSCDHIDDLDSDNGLIISRIVDELGIPKNEKEVDRMAKRLKRELTVGVNGKN